jgi:hypothetical protein
MKKVFFLLIILICSEKFYGFNIKSNHITQSSSDTLNIVTENYSDSLPDSSAYINIDYPQISDFKNDKVEKSVNLFLKNQFLQSKAYYEEIISDTTNFKIDGFNFSYSFETGFELPYNSDKFISIKLDHFEYTGGAHGNYYSVSYNIDMSDGKIYTLENVINKNDFNLLSYECEQAILDSFQVDSLTEAGLFENEITIKPDQDFYIIPGALVLNFDPYEIGPFSMGEINVNIPFYKIKDLLKPDLPFKTN